MRPNRSLFAFFLLMLIPVSITLGADAAGGEPKNGIRGHDGHDTAAPHLEFTPIDSNLQYGRGTAELPFHTIDIDKVGQFGGSVHGLFKQGNYLYVPEGWNLTVLDVSNPRMPSSVGHLPFYGSAPGKMASAGSKLYFVRGRSLGVIDNSTPTSPEIVATFETSEFLSSITFDQKYLYVGGDAGLYILDVHSDQMPIEVGFFDTEGRIERIVAFGRYAYLASAKGLYIVDVSDPYHPIEVGRFSSDYIYDIDLADQHAYLASWDKLYVVDVSNPSHPQARATYFRGESDPAIYVVRAVRKYVYFSGYNQAKVQVIDFSDLNRPNAVGTYMAPSNVLNMIVDDEVIYLDARGSGLRIIDVNSPATPAEVGEYDPWSGGAVEVYVESNYAYLGGSSGLSILDVSALDEVELVSRLRTLDGIVDIEVVAGYAYLANRSEGLRIVDIHTPIAPEIVGGHYTSDLAVGLAVDGNHAYVAARSAGLRIFDISNPRTPIEVGLYPDLIDAGGVAVKSGFAYVVAGSNRGGSPGLYIFDVKEPTSPNPIGYFATESGRAERVDVVGQLAFLADRRDGLRIIDVSNPLAPIEIGSFPFGDAVDVAIDGAYAHVVDWDWGYYILNVSNPRSPTLVGFSGRGPSTNLQISLSDGLAYVTNPHTGLSVYQSSSTHTIYGRVTTNNGAPLSGVLVRTLFAYTATTDTNGEFAITRLAPGTYNVTAEQAGFQFSSAEVTIPPSVEGVLLVGESDYDYDATFRPAPNGFQFNNGPLHEGCAAQGWGCYPDVLTRNDFTTSDLQRMFGEDAVCLGLGQLGRPCLLYRFKALKWLVTVNSAMNDGHCFGMAASSVHLFDDPDAMPLVYSRANAYDLPLPAIRRSIAAFHVKQFAEPFKTYRDIQEEVSTPKSTLGDLKAVLDTGSPAVLVMTGQSGHAVTAYALENRGDGVWHAKVYDNNGPGRSDPYIEIDEERNVWRYTTYDTNGNVVSERTGDDKTHSLYVVPDAILTGPQQPPEDWVYQGADRSDSEDFEIWLTGPGHVLVTDTSGNQTGFRGGELVNEIPGAHARVVFGGVGDAEPIYELPADDSYTLLLHPEELTGSERTDLTQFGLGYAVSVTDVDILPSTADTVEIQTDGSAITYEASNPIEPNVTLIFDDASSSDSYELRGVDIGEGRTVSIEADREAEQLVFVSTDEAGGSYDFLLNLADTTSTRRFRHLDIAIGGNDTHYLDHSGWDGRGPIRLLVDENSDGSIDQELELENQPEEYLMLLPTIVR